MADKALSAESIISSPPEEGPVVVAVYRGAGWSSTVSLVATAHERDCSGAEVDRELDEAVEVPPGDVVKRSLVFEAVDADGDGFVSRNSRGTDCDDAAPSVNPSAAETCGDGADNDCDGAEDCVDSTCAGAGCDDADPCTEADSCGANGSCTGVARTCDAPPGPCHVDAGGCAMGACSYALVTAGTSCGPNNAFCRADGGCAAPDPTETLCDNGIDDDADGMSDCADSSCSGQACDAGPCWTNRVCGSSTCNQGGGQVTCAAPPNQCYQSTGTCSDVFGCQYQPLASGASCDDQNACSLSPDSCDGAGVCTPGTARTCSAPPGACFSDAGVCGVQDGGCSYPPLATGAPCGDSDPCTFSEECDGAGVCAVRTNLCAQPPECQLGGASACDGKGGCDYVNANSGTCPTGACLDGQCKPTGPFPYAPSNFNPAGLDYTALVQIDCLTAAFDSADGGFTPCPTRSAPRVTLHTQPGGGEIYVLSMDRLDLSSSGALRLTGSRPIVLAIATTSKTQIDGLINARALLNSPGPGGNDASCGARAGAPGVYGIRGGGGGGGGYRTVGGSGGAGGNGAEPAGDGGSGTLLADGGLTTDTPWMPLLGGCPGGAGGGSSPTREGFGGAGGGALQITVAGELEVANGIITVSGGGGRGAVAGQAGGGGGGSAGTLLLEGNRITLGNSNLRLTANGGAGGEGESAGGTNGANGGNGSDNSATAAVCGSNSTSGGNGGSGAAATTGPGTGEQQSAGGGGGGGAAGRIWLRVSGPAALCIVTAGVRSPPHENAGGCP